MVSQRGDFYLESGSKRSPFFLEKMLLSGWYVFTPERQVTYPEDSPQGKNTYAEDSSREDGSVEDDIDMVDSSGRVVFPYRGGGEGCFNMEGIGGEDGFEMVGGSEEDIGRSMEQSYLLLC